ncbi:FAD/NAD(P)-binding oxidoreductase family protein [Rhynchospora pubera]|uniref:FAD/NAD(P)-binding oxidoreductase family protein n=1 Tax=Rhynchospora pubera TaxID=906938 RepID=A0AAV8HHL3_9POAL|nr:FAD/NAD(P)-binding oxidoreductase family protein [Rhynchospora pubera]
MAEPAKSSAVVVVVGGGVAGAFVAKSLQSHAQVVLIEPKDYLEIPYGELRSKVEPLFAERTLIKHTDYLTDVRIINTCATGITEKEVLTEDGGSVTYDYLVIATGHVDSATRIRDERLEEFKQDNQKIESSRLQINSGSRLLEFVGPKASKKALDWLVSKKVDVLLNETVEVTSLEASSGTYTISSGEKITADCHFVCVGKRIGSGWLSHSFLKESLDDKGRLQVDKNLRVRGSQIVFAAGDITDVPEIKQGYLAQAHAMVIAKNIKLLINGSAENKLATYTANSSAPALVSLGRKGGVAQLPCFTVSGWLPAFIKSRDLFIGKVRKEIGLKA